MYRLKEKLTAKLFKGAGTGLAHSLWLPSGDRSIDQKKTKNSAKLSPVNQPATLSLVCPFRKQVGRIAPALSNHPA